MASENDIYCDFDKGSAERLLKALENHKNKLSKEDVEKLVKNIKTILFGKHTPKGQTQLNNTLNNLSNGNDANLQLAMMHEQLKIIQHALQTIIFLTTEKARKEALNQFGNLYGRSRKNDVFKTPCIRLFGEYYGPGMASQVHYIKSIHEVIEYAKAKKDGCRSRTVLQEMGISLEYYDFLITHAKEITGITEYHASKSTKSP